MKGLKPIAVALVLALSAAAGAAVGEPHGHGGGWGHGGGGWSHGGDEGRGGGPPPWARGGGEGRGRYEGSPPGWAGPQQGGHGRWSGPQPSEYGYERGYAPAAPPFFAPHLPDPRGYALRRGGRAPPQVWNNVIPDYGRHRLRPPPPGYSWVRMGDRYMLVSRATGQIFDVIGR